MSKLRRLKVALLYTSTKLYSPLQTLSSKILAILLLVSTFSRFLLFLYYNITLICNFIKTRKGLLLAFNAFANLLYIVLYIRI